MEIVKPISAETATEERILALERALGASLPKEYRDFLLRRNGGRASESGFEFTDPAGKPSDSRVAWFFGLSDSQSYGLGANLETYGDRVPSGFLPIALDPFGNLILMAVGADRYGTIWFWDHEMEEDEPSLNNISKVADSFGEFLSRLR